jgi:hypothetical protein
MSGMICGVMRIVNVSPGSTRVSRVALARSTQMQPARM